MMIQTTMQQITVILILLSPLHFPGINGCGGSWSENVYNYYVSHDDEFTQCSYIGVNIGAIPTDIREETQFLKLHAMELHNEDMNISSIDDQVSELWALSLDQNSLTLVPNLSVFNQSLRYLSLKQNQIATVDFEFFIVFQSLLSLYLNVNRLSSQSINPAIDDQNSIRYLYLDNNNFTVIDMKDFQTLDLIELRLSRNPVSEFTCSGCESSQTIPYLFLKSIDVSNTSSLFQNLNGTVSFKHIIMENSNFEYGILNLNVFLPFASSLINIKLSHSNIESIIPLSSGEVFPVLNNLEFKNNPLTSCFNLTDVNGDVMPELSSLHLTSITGLTLCPIENGTTPSSNRNLYMNAVDMSGCFNMNQVDETQFSRLVKLQLSSNSLTGVCVEESLILTNLESLLISGNDLTSMDLGFLARLAPNLKYLYLDSNSITQLTFPETGQSWPLQHLDLSSNPLTTIWSYCEPHFDTIDWEDGFTIVLDDLPLQCDRCIAWLKSCRYKITVLNAPLCSGPSGLTGTSLINITLLDLAEHSCSTSGSTDTSAWYKHNTSGINGTYILLTTVAPRGQLDCARRSVTVGGASFTYSDIDNICVIYGDGGGAFDRN